MWAWSRGGTIQPRCPTSPRLYPEVAHHDRAEETLRDAHAVVVCTEWDKYRDITPERITELLTYPVVVDACNLWNADELGARISSWRGSDEPIRAGDP